MRRARIKALATVPVRRKAAITPADTSDVPLKENTPEGTSDTLKQENVLKQENILRQENVLKQENILKQEVESALKIQEEPTENAEDKMILAQLLPQPIIEKVNVQQLNAQVNNKNDKPEEDIDYRIQKSTPSSEVSPVAEAVPVSVSPVKVTQSRSCFMRPTPRLDSGGRVRKNSIQGSGASASESEDEHGKRTTTVAPSRMRNDSVCSVQSNKESSVTDGQNNSPRIKIMQKRRMLISESARKLAEARREFLLKHENKTPDRSQLKMYDLIYYNPVTNPMKSKTSTVVPRRVTTPLPEEVLEEEEEADDPSAIPAPQVKVGPDGQLIIDEQSLVIEQTGAKRSREILAQEAIVEDDDHGGGFYKKRQKSKEWSKLETFKFYRALNIVGTDFLLMQTLFPNRTRQQIKQKYKKEERVNRPLIEKALKYHQEFNIEMLEEQLAMLHKLENIEPNTDKKTLEKDKNDRQLSRNARKRRRRFAASSIAECESFDNEEAEDATMIGDETDKANDKITRSQNQQTRKESKRKSKKSLNDKINDSYASSDDDSDSETEVYRVRPTRSGRVPKVKRLRGPDINTFDSGAENESIKSEIVTPRKDAKNVIEDIAENNTENITEDITDDITGDVTENSSKTNGETSCPENITTVISDINQIAPGSFVILSKKSVDEPGNTILQVYMVSSNLDKKNADDATDKSEVTPVDLPSELLPALANKLEDVEAINIMNDE